MTVVLAQRLAQVVPAPVSVEAVSGTYILFRHEWRLAAREKALSHLSAVILLELGMPGSDGKKLSILRKDICRRASSGNFFQFREKPGDGL